MNNQFLVSLSQQMAANRSMEVIANNLANLSTPAYKRENMLFEKYVVPVQASEGEGGANGTVDVSFVKDSGVVRDFSEGEIEPTNAPFDFAINGSGYFVVQTANGERYSRNGHFSLDDSGQLVTDRRQRRAGRWRRDQRHAAGRRAARRHRRHDQRQAKAKSANCASSALPTSAR